MLKVRKVNTTYRIPFVYGNTAVQIAQAENEIEPERHTHRWTLFVRGVNGEDISYYVKKVEFKLHESFEDPARSINASPFEVSSTGWGEFSVVFKVFFKDTSEKPIILTHNLTLFEHKDLPNTLRVEPYGEGVKSEYYDEFVFHDPTMEMAQILDLEHHKSLPIKPDADTFYTKEVEEKLMSELDQIESILLQELQGK